MNSPHLLDGAPGIFAELLMSVQVLKRERVGCGKQREVSAPIQSLGKSTALVPEFAVKDLSLSRTAALVLEFAVKDQPLGRIL